MSQKLSRNTIRGGFCILLVLLAAPIALAVPSIQGTPQGVKNLENATQETLEGNVTDPEQVTVITGDSNVAVDRPKKGPKRTAELVAVNEAGDILYRNSTYDKYWDVDPVTGTRWTVMYVAANKTACNAPEDYMCYENVVEIVNLSTGKTTQLLSRSRSGGAGLRWHDADLLGDERIAVADIARDTVFIYNYSRGLTTWQWDAQSDFPTTSGGDYPDDWTHLNDVEQLSDGRLMVSLRNQDSVVFLSPNTGLQENWTLGEDDNHDVLYEQHNPDYINNSRGGPAILVADSENNRVLEYQRTDGGWTQSWTWSDDELQWPRDADRLPNGNTLITDTNGNRILEVNEEGEIIWKYNHVFPYEAERLGTGDESMSGPSASRLGIASIQHRTTSGDVSSSSLREFALSAIQRLIPSKIANAALYVAPYWMGLKEVIAVLGLVCVIVGWIGAEVWWRRDMIQPPVRLD